MGSSEGRRWPLLLRTLSENEVFRLEGSPDPDSRVHDSDPIHDLTSMTAEGIDTAVEGMLTSSHD